MYVVYSNCLCYLSIVFFTYNKNLLPPPKKKNSKQIMYTRELKPSAIRTLAQL